MLLSISVLAQEPAKVVVLDSGLNLNDERFQGVLCKEGHMDFTGTGLTDTNGHGTHIAGLIKTFAKKAKYCLIIIKYYDEHIPEKQRNAAYFDAIAYLDNYPIDVINISGGGNWSVLREHIFVMRHKEIKFIVAAGNDHVNLDDNCKYYPACYKSKNIITVGALTKKGKKATTSNYGNKITAWELGEDVLSYGITGMIEMSGTSQATAIHTGKYLNENY